MGCTLKLIGDVHGHYRRYREKSAYSDTDLVGGCLGTISGHCYSVDDHIINGDFT